MGLEAVRHVIVEMARLEEYQPTAASEQEFQNLNLTTKVQAALMMSPTCRNLHINVRAEQGQVHVSRVIPQFTDQELIQLIEGVHDVTKVVPDFIDLPAHLGSDY